MRKKTGRQLVFCSCQQVRHCSGQLGILSFLECQQSCVDIVEILMCEDKDVEQWFEPRNMSCCLRLIHYLLTLSLLYFTLL